MQKKQAVLEILQHDSRLYNQIQERQGSKRLGKLQAFLSQYKEASQWAVSVAALQDALGSGVKPTNKMVCEAIAQCGMAGKLSTAKQLYTSFYRKLDRPRPLEAHVAFMGACASSGAFREAHTQFHALLKRDKAMIEKNATHVPIVNDDLLTQYLRTALSATVKKLDQTTPKDQTQRPQPWQTALEDFLEVRRDAHFRKHIALTPLVLECATQLSEHGGQWALCLQILNTAVRQQEVVPPEAYDAAIRACYHQRKHYEVVNLVNDLIATRTAPDERSVRLSLTSCEEVAAAEKTECVEYPTSWRTAMTLFNAMKDNGLAMFQQNYEAPLRTCALAARWEEAFAILDVMKRDNRPVSLPLYQCVLAARLECAASSSELEKFMALPVLSGGEPSVVVYVAALRNCLKRKDWAFFDRLNKEMKDRDVVETYEKMLLLIEAAYERQQFHSVLMRFLRFNSTTSFEKKRILEWGTVRLHEEDFDIPERLLDMVLDAYQQLPGKKSSEVEAAYHAATLRKEQKKNSPFERLPLSHKKDYREPPPSWMFSQSVRDGKSPE
ncbi:hypothetical protein, conserved [Angomonas deanei]|uniref:Uncharacterized protein n=1 Tax=Angomonas deanei TaxID=59799 RepID=A0A7G2CJ30_9TRYP|nr:hypothetical protein, conserved [Angomonas deanei]